jgi:hypothetical protein
MKKFVKYVVVFFVPLVVCGIAMELLLRQIPNDYAYKNDCLQKHSNEITQLYLGNSHAYFGIDPKYLSGNAFNAGMVSQSIDYDWAILKKHQDNWKNLKCIVIPVDYFSLFLRIDTGLESWRAKNYTIYHGLPDRDLANHFEVTSSKLYANVTRLWEYYIKGKTDLHCSKTGWGTYYNSAKNQDLVSTGKISAQRHTANDYNCYTKNVAVLDSIIAFAEHRNIKLVLVSYPTHQTYRSHLNVKQMALTLQTIKQKIAEHPDVRYYNLMSDPEFVARDFYNADHMNEIGTKKLTLKIGRLTAQ